MSGVNVENFKQLCGHLPVHFVQILGHQEFNDKNVFFHVPAAGMFLAERRLRRLNESFSEILNPLSYVFCFEFVRNTVEANNDINDHDCQIVVTCMPLQ